jgi:hypothetical protein
LLQEASADGAAARFTFGLVPVGSVTDSEFFAVWLVFVAAGFAIGLFKGHPILGAVLGAFLSFVGVIVIALVPQTAKARARSEVTKPPKDSPAA